jgi:D-inositol-3-phosphate glycosyltransferase
LGICDDKIILFVGRLEPLKGIDFLFKVVEALGADRRFKLFIVGGMSENDPEVLRLKALSEKMGLSATVVFVNRVDRQELATYFSAADVCLVPSYYESFGLVALESMACGTPVIASRVGGLPSLIKHGKTGFLMPWRCPDSYADRLMMIFQNSQLSESMRNASIRYATSLAWPRVAPLVLSAYESLVPTRKS